MELTKTMSLPKKFVACVASVALAASVAFAGASQAFALQTGNETAPGSITVHKYSAHSAALPGATGTELDKNQLPEDAKPLGGVEFKLTKLDTNAVEGNKEGVDALMDPTKVGPEYHAAGATPLTGTTNDAGEYKFANLEFGYYLLEEVAAPAGYDKMESAVISVPFHYTAADGTETFVKDVHVYPKNTKSNGATKTVDGDIKTLKPGDDISFKLQFNMPSADKVLNGNKAMSAIVTDMLPVDDEGKPVLSLKGNASLFFVADDPANPIQATLADLMTQSENAEKTEITWTSKNPDFAQFVKNYNDANPTKPIKYAYIAATFTVGDNLTSMAPDANGDVSLVNWMKADVKDSEGGSVVDPDPEPSDPTTTIGFSFHKKATDENDSVQNVFEGATFRIAASADDANAGTFLGLGNTVIESISKAPANQQKSWVTFTGLDADNLTKVKADGTSTPYTAIKDAVAGLTAGNSTDITLYVMEKDTGNPDYILIDKPQAMTFTISMDDKGNVTAKPANLEFMNYHKDSTVTPGGGNFDLPNTGGMGALMIVLAGLVLVVGSAAWYKHNQNRTRTQDVA